MLAGTQCTQIVTEAAQNGMKSEAKYLFMPQGCAGTDASSARRSWAVTARPATAGGS